VWEILPGTAVAVAVMLLASLASRYFGSLFKIWLNVSKSPISTFMIAILFGMAVRNLIPFPQIFESGFKFCVSKLLRLGIIFLGIRLSILSMARIGLVAIAVVFVCIVSGITITTIIARAFRINPRLGTLIAAGTAICGVSAVVATAPVIGARDEETAYAVSTITIFGLIATLLYPYLSELVLRLDLAQAGLFLGTAVHDTSQVTGAAYIYDQIWSREVSEIAITTKLIRNTFMVAVIPLLSLLYANRNGASDSLEKRSLLSLFPVFVFGFIAFAGIRSIGDILIIERAGRFLFWGSSQSWFHFHNNLRTVATQLLLVAIAGTGLSTRFSRLAQLSLKPFLIGLIAALSVGVVSLVMVVILRTPIRSLLM
jgi:uncharacterized integral membrane protein (TIGR00698 family)